MTDHSRLSLMLRESHVIVRRNRHKFAKPFGLTDFQATPLLTLIDNIYFFPITWRKFIIDHCRIQKSPFVNRHLLASASQLVETTSSDFVVFGKAYRYQAELDDVLPLLEAILGQPTSLSILSYFCRAERSIFVDDFIEQRLLSFSKEFIAATQATSIPQKLDYSFIFGLPSLGLFGRGESRRLSELIKNGYSTLRKSCLDSSSLVRLPAYNARKNIGYASQVSYLMRRYGYDTGQRDITTLDLLRLYADTGFQADGPMEIRLAWFYNDLKPRTYYCNGGTSYFKSLFIQEVANAICDILPSTNPATRFDISRIGPVPDGSFLITYDYSSFTSSLAELKYFLFWLAQYFRGYTIDVYDPFQGVISIDLGDYLHEYNEYANVNMAFSTERFPVTLEDPIFHMGLAGALGIKGNIVFSTALHGIALGAITERPDYDSVVGDDALTYISSHLFRLFVRLVNYLGTINPDKFSIIQTTKADPTRSTSFKYLKRPLDLNSQDTPVLGLLDFFPDVASCLYPEGDGFHTVIPGTTHESRVSSFIHGLCRYSLLVSRYLKEYHDIELHHDELESVRTIFYEVYKRLCLPVEGATPGSLIRDMGDGYFEVGYFIPPIETIDLFTYGWIEVSWWKWRMCEVKGPVLGKGIPPPLEVEVGSEFIGSTDIGVLQLLTDLRYLEKKILTTMHVFDDSYKSRLLFLSMEHQIDYDPIICEYTVLVTCPHWYDLISRYHRVDDQGILDYVSVISSVL